MGLDKFKVRENVFDNFTLRLLHKLEGTRHFDEIQNIISVGKEANVFVASKGDDFVVVKIYRLAACDFNKMFDYIRTDPRYLNLKKRRREIVFQWVEREYRNILKAREAGVLCPLPIKQNHHIIVEEFIGDDAPARPLKDLHPEDPEKYLDLVVEQMRKMHKAGLVHGDLSEFNILNHHEKPYFIDFSQSTTIKDMQYQELLVRDVRNITRFFKRTGIKVSEEEILNKITKE